jgi:hypothetical protein
MTPIRGIPRQRGNQDKLELVVIQNDGGDPFAIDAGERIAVVGADGGHLPPEKVASTLAALGIQKIPVGTKVKALNEYIEVIQRACRFNVETDGLGPSGISLDVRIAEWKAEEAGIQADPTQLPMVKKNFAVASQALLGRGKKYLEAGEWLRAENSISLAAIYAEKGEFSSDELDSASSCIRHLKDAAAAHRKGSLQERNSNLEQARANAKNLSISIDKSIGDILLSPGPWGSLDPQPNPLQRPLFDLRWTWTW